MHTDPTPRRPDAGTDPDPPRPLQRITVLGLGAMGRRMAARLVAAGFAVTVWNRSPGPADELRAAGATVADTPRAAAEGADVVISMLRDDEASRAVWLGADTGAIHGLHAAAIAVESGTVSPTWIGSLDDAVRARGARLVDAPVAGSRPQADAGQLAFLAGGDADTLARLGTVFAAMGSSVSTLGPVGAGAAFKLAVNVLFATQVAAMAEQLALLRASGLDPARSLAALKALPVTSPAAAGAGALMLAHDWTPQFPVSLLTKDLGYACTLARASTGPLPMLDATAARFDAARAAGWGDANLVAVARLYD